MLARTRKTASTRLTQLSAQSSYQFSRKANTEATRHTKHKLNTGAKIPAIGFGTWRDANAEQAVKKALKAGYRHIDTARVYGTECAVGDAIKKSGIPRSEIFITSKLWNNSHHPDDVKAALKASLKRLGTKYLDLYIMHWPSPFARSAALRPMKTDKIEPGDTDYIDTWKAMEKTLRYRKTRAIGIANFSKAELERLLSETKVVPAAHQLECHPLLQQPSFTAFNKSKGIHVQQYSPFGNQHPIYSAGRKMGKLIDDPTLVAIGEKYGKSGAQVALAWGIANGHSVLPKSKTPELIQSNLAGDFELDKEDLDTLSRMDKKLRLNDPSEDFGWNFFADLDGKQVRGVGGK